MTKLLTEKEKAGTTYKHITNDRLEDWKFGKHFNQGYFKAEETEKIDHENNTKTTTLKLKFYRANEYTIDIETVKEKELQGVNINEYIEQRVKYDQITLAKLTQPLNESSENNEKVNRYSTLYNELMKRTRYNGPIEEIVFSKKINGKLTQLYPSLIGHQIENYTPSKYEHLIL